MGAAMTEIRSKARQYSEGWHAAFIKREYVTWETDMWRQGWIEGCCARVSWAIKARDAIASMGIDTRPEKEN